MDRAVAAVPASAVAFAGDDHQLRRAGQSIVTTSAPASPPSISRWASTISPADSTRAGLAENAPVYDFSTTS